MLIDLIRPLLPCIVTCAGSCFFLCFYSHCRDVECGLEDSYLCRIKQKIKDIKEWLKNA